MTPRTLDARFRLATPAYLGGAPDGADHPAELRVPSLLGVLRFWWRALEWGRIVAAHPPLAGEPFERRYAPPLVELRRREDRLFGAAARRQGPGQGLVLARLIDVAKPNGTAGRPANGAAYLAGQGLRRRGALAAGTGFTLRFVVRPRSAAPATPEELASLARALRCLGLLGGVGSRSRHGYGSLVLEALACDGAAPFWRSPHDVEVYRAALADLNDGTWPAEEPPFTTFSQAARLCLVRAPAGISVQRFMEQQGHILQHFRSKGAQDENGDYKVNGHDARPHASHPFAADFAWFDALAAGGTPVSAPARAIFGLPHNYYSKRPGNPRAAVGAVVPDNARSDRRASPLFLHFHELGDGHVVAAWLFLPARFLPDATAAGPRLRVNGTEVDFTADWWPITRFYDEVLAAESGAVTVLP